MADPIAASEARARFADLVTEAGYQGKRFRLQRHGRDVAAVISAEDLAKLETVEGILDLEKIRGSLAEPGEEVTWTQLRADLSRGA